MNADLEFQRLAEDPNLVVSVEFCGRCYDAFIGDIRRGYRAHRQVSTFDAAVQWLHDQARVLYPQFRYVQ
jgi:hypothetical protein